MRACEIMTPHVITISANATIVEAIETMLRHHIGGLPVVDDTGRLIGIVSESDFLRRAETGTQHKRGRWLSFLAGADRVAAEFTHEYGRKVSDVMTPDPHVVFEDTPLDQVVRVMDANDIKRVLVMRESRLVGVITCSDFLKVVADAAHRVANSSADDAQIEGEVMASLQRAPWRPDRLVVNVCDGVVSLRGMVSNEAARSAAIVVAENIPGVRRVISHLCVEAPYPPPEQDYGGGDFVSLQEQPSTADDEPL
jgi:CBS domain-containing protein